MPLLPQSAQRHFVANPSPSPPAGALATLASSDARRAKIAAAGASPALVALIKHPCPATEYAARCVAALACSPPVRAQLAGAEAARMSSSAHRTALLVACSCSR